MRLGAGPMGLGAGPRSEVRGWVWGLWGLLELGVWGGAGWGLGLGRWGLGLGQGLRFGGWGCQKETETQIFDGLGYLKVGDFGGFWSWGFGVVLGGAWGWANGAWGWAKN